MRTWAVETQHRQEDTDFAAKISTPNAARFGTQRLEERSLNVLGTKRVEELWRPKWGPPLKLLGTILLQ